MIRAPLLAAAIAGAGVGLAPPDGADPCDNLWALIPTGDGGNWAPNAQPYRVRADATARLVDWWEAPGWIANDFRPSAIR